MKPRFSNQRNHALTLVEVLVVIVVLTVLAALLLPAFGTHSKLAREIDCNNNLKQIGFAFQIWKHDHNDKFPMQVSVMNGGIMEFTASGNVFASFLVLSNELQSSKVLVCPAAADQNKISYFIGLDADTNHLQAFLSGDDNFAINGIPVKSGLLELSTDVPISWTATRHKFAGNIGIADGSVMGTSSLTLRRQFLGTGLATNRLAIP